MHVYVHVPFCARRCSYCDFAIAVRKVTPNDAFVRAIGAEWQLRRHAAAWNASPGISTLYFGGGTPSRLDPNALAQIISCITRDHPLVSDAEVTIEANPEDVSSEKTNA